MTLVTLDAAKDIFADAEEAAIRDWTCFCRCGCRAPDARPTTRFNVIYPGLCRACAKRGFPRHDVATVATVWNDMEDAAEAVEPAPATVKPAPAAPVQQLKVIKPMSLLGEIGVAFRKGFEQGRGGTR